MNPASSLNQYDEAHVVQLSLPLSVCACQDKQQERTHESSRLLMKHGAVTVMLQTAAMMRGQRGTRRVRVAVRNASRDEILALHCSRLPACKWCSCCCI